MILVPIIFFSELISEKDIRMNRGFCKEDVLLNRQRLYPVKHVTRVSRMASSVNCSHRLLPDKLLNIIIGTDFEIGHSI